MVLSKEQLLLDLYKAFYDAKRHKSNKKYVKEFESNLHENLIQLRDELFNRTYQHDHFVAFIVGPPGQREVFAAMFRDRIVHHLYYNYVHKYFEKTFIYDSYSCIKGKGTSFGIKRLKHHILSASENYQKPIYMLKIDIKAYFININRNILLNIVLKQLNKFKENNIELDYDFLIYLSKLIILIDPLKNLKQKNPKAWKTYKKSKSMFYAKPNCGLPIGNLTSQLFSNVYLNLLDHFIKRILKIKHYGRYVDDGYLLYHNKKYLNYCLKEIEIFLANTLELQLSKNKIYIKNVKYGCEFLGAFIKPYRTYIANQALYRMKKHNTIINNKIQLISSINSRIGILKKYSSYNIRYKMFIKNNYGR